MATYAFVNIDLPEAADLADYTSISADLSSALEFARFLLEERSKEEPDWQLAEPLMIAMIVKYARPFVSGVRRRLGEDALLTLTPEQRDKHNRFYAIRDKYIAHSVNKFEENQPVARYWRERVQDEGISSVDCIHHRVAGLSERELHDIIELATALIEYVDNQLKTEKKKMLEIVRRMPVSEVLAGERRALNLDTSDPLRRRPR